MNPQRICLRGAFFNSFSKVCYTFIGIWCFTATTHLAPDTCHQQKTASKSHLALHKISLFSNEDTKASGSCRKYPMYLWLLGHLKSYHSSHGSPFSIANPLPHESSCKTLAATRQVSQAQHHHSSQWSRHTSEVKTLTFRTQKCQESNTCVLPWNWGHFYEESS